MTQAEASLRVLVVDDNVDAADSAAMLLRRSGHDVRVAYSSEAALEAAVSFRPHVILLDIGSPEMDGYEVARRLREHRELKDVRLVAVTGYGQTPTANALMRLASTIISSNRSIYSNSSNSYEYAAG